jgi:TRAP-type C4-dicarboxylate transport system substrate-binding protein
MPGRRFPIPVLVVALAGLALAAAPAAAQTNLTMSSWVPPTHSVTRSLAAWAQDVEKSSNGRVKITMLPKAPMAPTGTLDGVASGLVDVSFVSHGYTPGRFVLTKAAEMPFLGDTTEVTSVAYNRVHERILSRGGEHKGLKVLAMFTHGPGTVANTKKPITSLADASGMKIRVGGGLMHEVANTMGVNALLKPAPELYELLTSNVVDGTFGPQEMVVSFKLEKVLKYMTKVPGGLYNTSFAVLISEERFAKIPKADQDALLALCGETLSRRIGSDWDKSERAAEEAMRVNNIQVVRASPALVNEIRERTAPLEQQWVKDASGKGVDPAKALAELREEIKKVAAGK